MPLTAITTAADTLKAVADPIRLAMLLRVADGEASIDELAGALDLPRSSVAHHLARLNAAGLVNRRVDRGVARFALDSRGLAQAVEFLDGVAARLHEGRDSPGGSRPVPLAPHSHSIVPGGFDVTS